MGVQVQAFSDTLEESVCDTILRDLKNIWVKIKYVIVPRFKIQNDPEAIKELRNWDLWGPLLICLALSMYSQGTIRVVVGFMHGNIYYWAFDMSQLRLVYPKTLTSSNIPLIIKPNC